MKDSISFSNSEYLNLYIDEKRSFNSTKVFPQGEEKKSDSN